MRKGLSRLRVFEKGGGGIFGLELEQLAVDLRRMHNKKLYDLHNSQSVVWGIRSRGVGWAGHVASMEARIGATGIWGETGTKETTCAV